GNLNCSFITKVDGYSFLNFNKFTQSVVKAFKNVCVDADMKGRNDILVAERKISGNAQISTRNRMFSKVTLMFDSEIENVVSALKVRKDKIASKGIKSIRSRVANISEFMDEKMTVEEFRQLLLRNIFEGVDPIPEYKLTEKDWEKIHEISK